MASYLAQEVQLAKRLQETLSQRSVLLQQMETHLGDRETEKTRQMQDADAAHKRNVVLLNGICPPGAAVFGDQWAAMREEVENFILQDIEAAEKKLQAREHLLLHPDTVTLETLYWAKIEESIPKWEPFFLGRTQAPVGVRKTKQQSHTSNKATNRSIPR